MQLELKNETINELENELREAEAAAEALMVEVEIDQAALKEKWDTKMGHDATIWAIKDILGIKDDEVDTGAVVANEV